MEAMSYGVPCVVSNAWALPEIVTNGVTGKLVNCGHWEELAEVLVEMLMNPMQLKAYGKAGRESVQGHTWAAVVDRMIAALPA